MYSTTLKWEKCQGNTWCDFLRLNLNHPHFDGLEGVYIIWHGGSQPRVVYVGQGLIADRLREHRNDPAILQYREFGLFVTWARADAFSRPGVESFLAAQFQPLVGERHPNVPQIAANLPW